MDYDSELWGKHSRHNEEGRHFGTNSSLETEMVRISGRGTQIKRDGLEMYMLPLKPDRRPERWGSPGRGVGARVGMSAALEKVA